MLSLSSSVQRAAVFASEQNKTKISLMKMAFNGGCDTDGGPHNKRLCTGQNSTIINDNNNNTNGSGISNGTGLLDVDMNKGLGLVRVNFSPFDLFFSRYFLPISLSQ